MGRKMVVLVAITVGFLVASEEELRCLPTSPRHRRPYRRS